MVRKLLTIGTFAAVVMAEGCTKSEFEMNGADRKGWGTAQDPRVFSAKEEPPPKILPATYFAAGQLLERQGRIEPAIHQYQRAILVAHHYVAAHHRLGLLFSDIGRHEEALQCLRTAASLAPNSAIVRNNFGYELMLGGQWEDAEAELAKSVELEPDFARARINHAMVLSKLGRFDEALKDFRSVLPDADAHYNMGLMYRGQQRFQEASASFARVLDINPDFAAAAAQLEQLAPRLEKLAWNASEETDDGADSRDPGSPDSAASFWSPTTIDALSESSRRFEAADNPWVTMDIDTMSMSDGLEHRGPLADSNWSMHELSGSSSAPALDLSGSSSPPTMSELSAALSIVRNEIECQEAEAAEFGWTPAYADSATYGYADSSSADNAETSSSPSAFEAWLRESPSHTPGPSESTSRRRTMGMTILPSGDSSEESQLDSEALEALGQSPSQSSEDENSGHEPSFVGPPAPHEHP